MKKQLCILFLINIPFLLSAQKEVLSIPDIVLMAVGQSSSLTTASARSKTAYYNFMSLRDSHIPGIDFGTSYIYSIDDPETMNHSIAADLTMTQFLPTAGKLSFSLENVMTLSGNENLLIRQNPSVNLSLNQPLFTNGKLIDMEVVSGEKRSSEFSLDIQRIEQLNIKNRVIHEAIKNYFDILTMERDHLILLSEYKLLSEQIEYQNILLRQGSASISEIMELELDLSIIEKEIVEIEYNAILVKKLFYQTIGKHSESDRFLLSEKIPEILLKDKESLLKEIVEACPAIIKNQLFLEQVIIDSFLQGKSYSSALIFSLSIKPEYENSYPGAESFSNSFTDLFSPESSLGLNASISLSIPVFTGKERKYRKQISRNQEFIAMKELEDSILNEQNVFEMLFMKYENFVKQIGIDDKYININKMRIIETESLVNMGVVSDLEFKKIKHELDKYVNNLMKTKRDIFLSILDILSAAGYDLEVIFHEFNKREIQSMSISQQRL